MTSNLRVVAERDMRVLDQKDWYMPIILIAPDGEIIDKDKIDPTQGLRAVQILYDYKRVDPRTGGEMTVNQPVVVIARKSLTRIPLPGEKWVIKMPEDPDPDGALIDFVFTATRAPEGGRSVGFIRLYPTRAMNDGET